MFRPMRRAVQELTQEEMQQILAQIDQGVLCLHGDHGYPYGVPMNHVFKGGRLFFHCAPEGHKIDAIENNSLASYTVIAKHDVVPELLSTDYASVVVFGKAVVLDKDEDKRYILEAVGRRFSEDEKEIQAHIAITWDRVLVVELQIDHLSGKGSSPRTKAFLAKKASS